ncbi:MAG: DUF4340 domain-containing protein [Defluviitaleaceae bacterium]|nr:DUF4340 domain-containing protein [Defluviitaleaceae bacterium]
MKKKTIRIISMTVVVALIAALASVYFLREILRSVAEVDDPTEHVTHFLAERDESEVASVRFISQDSDFVMTPYETPFGILWEYAPNPDFVLSPARARDKVRPAWHLLAFEIAHENAADVNIADFGFAPPRLVMEVSYTDGTNKTIYFGAHTADMRNTFARVSGSDAIYIVGNMAAQWAAADIEALIERGIQPFSADAEYILIAQQGLPPIEMAMAAADDAAEALATLMPMDPTAEFLRLVQPIDRGIDHQRLSIRVLEPLEMFRIGDVVSLTPGSLAPYGLDTPSLEFIYRDMFGETHLLFGDRFVEDVAGTDVDFIYVKFADRPHVFRAEFLPASTLFNLNVFTFINRFIALPNIAGVSRITVAAADQSRNMDMVVNHVGESAIAPTINGHPVDESDFRTAYRLLIGLMMEGEIEPFTPEGQPDIAITYHRIDEPDIELRLYAQGSHLYAVSVNGEDAWFVTHGRDVDMFFSHALALVE